ncbi:prohibitin family protein [Castellaniella sp.]|uniref:prohibitin family protein n=1 Tax=Castellaniella sp. TaxID=1955812 RepID=UPI002AFEFCB8|nr:prohibitin family protein [Castellaniella sp.]
MNYFRLAAVGLVGLFILSIFGGSWYTVNERDRGVILRNGAIIGEAKPGLGFKFPFVDSVVDISLETQTARYESLQAYSRDQQPAVIGLSVIYRVPEDGVADVYTRFGSTEKMVERVVTSKVQEQVKNVFGGFNAVTAIQERQRLNKDVAGAITEAIKAVRAPVVIEAVQIEGIDFSDAYERSIEQRMLAEVEVQKLRQNAEREKVQAEIVVTQASAQADAVRQQAIAAAEAIRLKGDAEAEAIKARGQALGSNPNLVSLVQAERWDGKLPSTMVPGGAVPMVGIGK